jgi:hypothetical protein
MSVNGNFAHGRLARGEKTRIFQKPRATLGGLLPKPGGFGGLDPSVQGHTQAAVPDTSAREERPERIPG